MPDPKPSKLLTALDTVAAELEKEKVPSQAVASWLLPIFAHVQPSLGDAPVPERLGRLSRSVGHGLGPLPRPQED